MILQTAVAIMQHYMKDSKMFTAMILACLVTQECIKLEDDRGPYKTEVECKARAAEMMQDFISAPVTPPTLSIAFACIKTKGQNT